MKKIWTRDGFVSLKPESARSTLGNGPQERTEALIAVYASDHLPGMREALTDVYRRAYRRAGLLPGDPDEIETVLPPASSVKLEQ